MVVTQRTLQCFDIFMPKKPNNCKQMRPKAQKPKRKGMPYKQYHSLPSLAQTVHHIYMKVLSCSFPSLRLLCCLNFEVSLVEVYCSGRKQNVVVS